MYRFMRTYRFRAGKDQEAMRLAKEGLEHGRRLYGAMLLDARVLIDLFGDANAVHWCMDVDDLATLHELATALSQDDEFQKLVIRGADVWIDGSGRDTLMESI